MNTALIGDVSKRLLRALLVWLAFSIVALVVCVLFSDKGVPVTLATCAFGVLGGFISLHRRLKRLSEFDLRMLKKSWSYTLLSPLVGGLLAAILYIIFISGLISGDLFPTFVAAKPPEDPASPPSFQDLLEVRAENVHDYAKLLVWSFIAGFSEKFVINILGKFEAGVSPDIAPGPDTPDEQS